MRKIRNNKKDDFIAEISQKIGLRKDIVSEVIDNMQKQIAIAITETTEDAPINLNIIKFGKFAVSEAKLKYIKAYLEKHKNDN